MARALILGTTYEESFSSDALVFALHLAWEQEEDSESGRKAIVEFALGMKDPREDHKLLSTSTATELSEAIRRYNHAIHGFEQGRMRFWQ
jgi:hypothetical protein